MTDSRKSAPTRETILALLADAEAAKGHGELAEMDPVDVDRQRPSMQVDHPYGWQPKPHS